MSQEEERTEAVVEETTGEEPSPMEPDMGDRPACWCGVVHKEGSKIGKTHEAGPPIEEPIPEQPVSKPLPAGSILFQDAPIGQNFRQGGSVWKKINHGVVQNFQKGDDATEPMDGGTIIEPILPGHEVEPDA